MKGILADVNCVKHFRVLLILFQEESRTEYWQFLKLTTPSFADLGLSPRDPDLVLWEKCQHQELVLLTANRNDDGPDSLETTIRTHNSINSLPVFTLANADRVLHERSYAERVADRLLAYLFDIENCRGTGRLYLP